MFKRNCTAVVLVVGGVWGCREGKAGASWWWVGRCMGYTKPITTIRPLPFFVSVLDFLWLLK